MTIDFDLLDAAIEDAANEANGYKHNQGNWVSVVLSYEDTESACGTAMCLAGFAAMRAGAEVPQPQLYGFGGWYMPDWTVNTETGKLVSPLDFVSPSAHVSDFARDRLGLTGGQANALFDGTNTIDDLRAMRDHLRENPDAGHDELDDFREPRDEDDNNNDDYDY